MDEAKKKMTGTPVIFFSLYPKTAKPASGSACMAGQIAPQRLTELPLRAALRRSVASSRLAALKGDFRSAKGAGLADKCNLSRHAGWQRHGFAFVSGGRAGQRREMPHPLMLLFRYKRKTRCCSNGFFRERTPNINTLRRGISHIRHRNRRMTGLFVLMPRDLPGPQRA